MFLSDAERRNGFWAGAGHFLYPRFLGMGSVSGVLSQDDAP